VRTAWSVSFEPLGGGRTRVGLSMDVGSEHAMDLPEPAVRAVEGRVQASLEAFKALVEARRDDPVDAWGGAISGGVVTPDVATTKEMLSADGAGSAGPSARGVERLHEASEGDRAARGTSETGGEPEPTG
jgi:hypothetical protein